MTAKLIQSVALRMGADDYLTKDISMAHLAARIGALFRRVEAQETPPQANETIEQGDLELDLKRMRAVANQAVDLTVTEFRWYIRLLSALVT